MKVVQTAVTEIIGLFVEDGSLAVGILIWLAVAAFGLPMVAGLERWRAPILFAGLVILLVENIWRSAKKHVASKK